MTIIRHKAQRVAILIDVQNMYHSAKNLYGARVDFDEVVKAAVAGRELVRVIGYVIKTETGEEKPFLEALNKIGIETKIKDLQIFPGGVKKADWDVGIAVDAIRLSRKADALVLISGDGDFVPLLEYLKQVEGLQTEVMAFGRSASQRLKDSTDDFVDLSENTKKYLLRRTG